jgi:hypothetical protein
VCEFNLQNVSNVDKVLKIGPVRGVDKVCEGFEVLGNSVSA